MHACTHAQRHACMHARAHTCIYAACTPSSTHARMRSHTHTCTRMHTRACARMHVYIRTRTCTRARMCAQLNAWSSSLVVSMLAVVMPMIQNWLLAASYATQSTYVGTLMRGSRVGFRVRFLKKDKRYWIDLRKALQLVSQLSVEDQVPTEPHAASVPTEPHAASACSLCRHSLAAFGVIEARHG